jgi:hypothetical protein
MQNRVILQKFAKISKETATLFFYHKNASPGSPGAPVYSTNLYRRRVPEETTAHCTALIGPDLVSPFSESLATKITFFCYVVRCIQVGKYSKVMKF